MKNADVNKGTTEDIDGAEGINNGKSSVTECPVKDREVGLESNEVETGNVNFYSESKVDCFLETNVINIRTASTISVHTDQNKNNMIYVHVVNKLSSNSDNKLVLKATKMIKEGKEIDYARVLVEIDDSKGFKDVIQLMYKDKLNNCKGVKKVKMKYSWKPPISDYYKVFGHVDNGCTSKPRVINVDTAEKSSASAKEKLTGGDNDGFTNVNHKRKNMWKKSTNSGSQQNVKVGGKDNVKSQQIPLRKPEVVQKKPDQNWKPKQASSSNKNQFDVLNNHDLTDENQELLGIKKILGHS
nr:hypothetical protein [Tanacetum cinerariifolium]